MLSEKERLKLLTLVFHNSQNGIILTDGIGTVIMTNQRHQDYSDIPAEEIIGKNIQFYVDNKVMSKSSTLQVLKTGSPVIMEEVLHRGEKNQRSIIVRSIPILEDGGIRYVITYLYDISEKKTLMKEIEDARRQNIEYELMLVKINGLEKTHLIYKSKVMEELTAQARKIADTEATVLITGQSGVGKGVLARYIHDNSDRSQKPFFTINCGAIPENLMESELFGYENGAFTGASSGGKAGLLESADKGTVFLDEIGDMPYNLQVKVLRALQQEEFFRVGGVTPVKVDVRFITATNHNLSKMAQTGKFRKDLYYRINVISLYIPPLDERPEDIPVMAEYFLKKMNLRYDTKKSLSKTALTRLMKTTLPGNVRELENRIERSVLLSPSDLIQPEDLFDETDPASVSPPADAAIQPCSVNGKINLKQYLENEERSLLQATAQKYKTTAMIAKMLGIDQSTAWRKLKKYKIKI